MATSIDPSEVHYRLVSAVRGANVVCVQDFDYPHYDFLTSGLYATQEGAEAAAAEITSPRDILANLIYINSYPNPSSPHIQALIERSENEQATVYRQADAIIAAGIVQV